MASDNGLKQDVSDLIYREATLLDRHRWDEWIQLYTEDAVYWVPAWAKVTKYRVDPGFYDSTLHTLVNLKKWNSLDQAQQALLNKLGLMFETKADPASDGFKAMAEKQKAWFKSKGIETIELSGMERDKWAKAAKAEGWKEVLARSPKHGAKLQKLFTK